MKNICYKQSKRQFKFDKAFTLIELLAVITILAIIALITTPIVITTIDNTRKKAAEVSATMYLNALEKQISINNMYNDNPIVDGVYTDFNELRDTYKVSVSGELPSSGTINIESGSVKKAIMVINDYIVSCNDTMVCKAIVKNNTIALEVGNISVTTNSITIPYTLKNKSNNTATIACIYGDTEDNKSQTGTVSNNECIINNLDSGTKYYYSIIVKINEFELYEYRGNITTKKNILLSIDETTLSSSSIVISYDLINALDGMDIECLYGISEDGKNSSGVIDKTEKTCTMSDLAPDTTYYYTINVKEDNEIVATTSGHATTRKISGITIADAPSEFIRALKVVYMDPTDISRECNSLPYSDTNPNGYNSATEIKSGYCMRWYVYSDNGQSAKMILDHNTTAKLVFSSTDATNTTMKSEIEKKLADDTKNWKIDSSDTTKITSVSVITGDEIATITGKTDLNFSSLNKAFYLEGTGTNYQTLPTYTSTNTSAYAWLYNNTYKCKSDDPNYGCTIEDNTTTYTAYQLDTATDTFKTTDTVGYTYGYWTNTGVASATTTVWGLSSKSQVGRFSATALNFGIRPVVTIPSSLIQSAIPKVVYLDPTDLSASCNASNSVSTTETRSGCMKWYVYYDDGETAKLLLDHNTTARLTFSDTDKATMINEIKMRLQYDTTGVLPLWEVDANDDTKIKEVSVITADEVASITGKTWNSETSTEWFNLQGTGEKYQTLPTYTSTNTSAYAWLFNNTYQCNSASINYGCTIEDNAKTYETYKFTGTISFNGFIISPASGSTTTETKQYTTPEFTTTGSKGYTIGYWTDTPYAEAEDTVWRVTAYNRLTNTGTSNVATGIRPVITISSSLIANQ